MTIKIQNKSFTQVVVDIGKLLDEGRTDENVRRLAELAIANREDDQIAAVYDFVKENFQYASDPVDVELFVHPKRAAKDYFDNFKRSFDCGSHALLVASMLGSIGFKTRIIIVDSDFDKEYDHAIAQALSDKIGDYVSVDTTDRTHPLGWKLKVGGEIIYIYD